MRGYNVERRELLFGSREKVAVDGSWSPEGGYEIDLELHFDPKWKICCQGWMNSQTTKGMELGDDQRMKRYQMIPHVEWNK